MRRGTLPEEEQLQLQRESVGGSDQRPRFLAEKIVLVRVRAERRVGEDDGDGAGDGVAVAAPERKLLEQEAFAFWFSE